MALTEKEKELVAIGASIGNNCIPCLEQHFQRCRELGLSRQDLREAYFTSKKVKEAPIKKTYEAAERLMMR